MAGALAVTLGGTNAYDGIVRTSPILGASFARTEISDIARARRTVAYVTVACTIALTAARAFGERRSDAR